MHAKVHVCIWTEAHRLERRKRALVLLIVRLLWLTLGLQMLLELSNGRTIERVGRENAAFEGTTIEAGMVTVEALADNLPTANND